MGLSSSEVRILNRTYVDCHFINIEYQIIKLYTVDNKLIAGEKFNSACYRKVRFRSEFVAVIIDSAVSLLSISQIREIT